MIHQGLKKIKILFLTGGLVTGGSEIQLLKLLGNLPEEIEPHLVFFSSGDLFLDYEKLKISMYSLEKAETMLGKVNLFYKFVKEINPDIIQSQLPIPNLISILVGRYRSIPVIINERGMGITRPRWEKFIRKHLYRWATFVFCNSIAIRDRLVDREKVSFSKITVVPNIIKSELYAELNGIRRDGMEKNLLCIASLKPVKGIVFLIQAMKILSSKLVANLIIAGDGPYRKQYELLAEKLGIQDRIVFLGVKKDLDNILNTVDLLVSSSVVEGTSNAILEAMALGVPVVATAVGGTVDIIEHCVNGYLVKSESPESIAEGIERLLVDSELCGILIKNGKSYIRSHHSSDIVVPVVVDVYKRTVQYGKKL